MKEVNMLDEILRILIDLWKCDIEMFKPWWMWAPCGIPATFYAVFMLLKWVIITCPLWIPVKLALSRTIVEKK